MDIQKQKRVTIIFGTRPEAIKLAPVIKTFRDSKRLAIRVVLTGQHKEMVDQVCSLFDLKIDKDLELMTHGQSLNELTSNIIRSIEKELSTFRPDLVLVQGDTTSAFASALAAFYEKIPVAHVEAGLRTKSMFNPFPEELNRRMISQLSSLHFAPTVKSANNLYSHNIKEDVYITGNTIIDALISIENQAKPKSSLGINWQKNKILLASVHRRENWGENLDKIAFGLKKISDLFPEVYIVLPMHKNLKVREPLRRIIGNKSRIILCEPFNYLEMIGAIKNCYLLITDSGGLQEEAPTFGKPVVVLRDSTERIEGIESGSAKLVGTKTQDIVETVSLLLKDKEKYKNMSKIMNPYGDGKASKRILNKCLNFLGINSKD